MASIQTAIELQDNFTDVLYRVVDSVNLSLAAMEALNRTMGAPFDTAFMETARDSIDGATAAVRELDEAMRGLHAPAPIQICVAAQSPVDHPAPISWQADRTEVFTSTGIDRFRQEVQDVNGMLERLGTTQDMIARQAYNMDLFPPEAFRNLNSLAVRIDMLSGRILMIENHPLNMGTDAANRELEQLRAQLDRAVREQESLNRAVGNMDVQAANEAYLRLSQTVGGTERYIRDNVDEQGRFNREIGQGTEKASRLSDGIRSAAAAAANAVFHAFSAAAGMSDQMAQTNARLNRMNDGLHTTQELQDMIYLSAQRSRSSYLETADAVSRFGLTAGNAFGSSEEIIAFMEQINKQFQLAGAETTDMDAGMQQLAQVMGSGVLCGEEYNSILEKAPNIIQTIADYMGVPQERLRDMAEEGKVTAGTVKAAIFAAADETNAAFENMPVTFGQVWNSFQNTAEMGLRPVLEKLGELADSEQFQGFVGNAAEAFAAVAGGAQGVFDLLAGAAGLVKDNWSWLSPIIFGVAGALAVYYGWQMLCAIAAKTVSIAQGILNAVMSANPVMLVVLAVIALIAVFYALIGAINKFAGDSVSATGLICGVFMSALAFVGNIFAAAVNFVIDLFVTLWNFVASFANFFANVFHDPVTAVKRLFFDLVDTALSLLQSMASAIDWIFGSNLSESVQGWRDSLGDWVEETYGKGEEIMQKVNAEDFKLGRFEYGEAWDAGNSFGEGIEESISNFDLFSLFGQSGIPKPEDYENVGEYDTEAAWNLESIAGDTGAIKDSVAITGEELKYLHDIAEQEVVNRYTTGEIKIEQTNYNTVSGAMDLDGIIDGLTDSANEAADMIAEGV